MIVLRERGRLVREVLIAPLSRENEERFFALAAEYLPDSDQDRMRRFAQLYPEAFLTLSLDGRVIGVAYGWFRRHFAPEDPSFTLDGICIEYDCWRKGYGTRLMAAFEAAARDYGAQAVSVGSGLVAEPFYIACGYFPKEYKVWVDGKPWVEKTFATLAEYSAYERQEPDGFIVLEKVL